MAKKDKKKKEVDKRQDVLMKVEFGFKNYLLFGLGIVAIVIGFISLKAGSITLAPILLIVGYLVFIPLAILLKPSKEDKKTGEKAE